MNHLSISKTKGSEHFPLLNPNLSIRLQHLLNTRYVWLAPDDPIRLDIEKFIAMAKNSSFAEAEWVSDTWDDPSCGIKEPLQNTQM